MRSGQDDLSGAPDARDGVPTSEQLPLRQAVCTDEDPNNGPRAPVRRRRRSTQTAQFDAVDLLTDGTSMPSIYQNATRARIAPTVEYYNLAGDDDWGEDQPHTRRRLGQGANTTAGLDEQPRLAPSWPPKSTDFNMLGVQAPVAAAQLWQSVSAGASNSRAHAPVGGPPRQQRQLQQQQPHWDQHIDGLIASGTGRTPGARGRYNKHKCGMCGPCLNPRRHRRCENAVQVGALQPVHAPRQVQHVPATQQLLPARPLSGRPLGEATGVHNNKVSSTGPVALPLSGAPSGAVAQPGMAATGVLGSAGQAQVLPGQDVGPYMALLRSSLRDVRVGQDPPAQQQQQQVSGRPRGLGMLLESPTTSVRLASAGAAATAATQPPPLPQLDAHYAGPHSLSLPLEDDGGGDDGAATAAATAAVALSPAVTMVQLAAAGAAAPARAAAAAAAAAQNPGPASRALSTFRGRPVGLEPTAMAANQPHAGMMPAPGAAPPTGDVLEFDMMRCDDIDVMRQKYLELQHVYDIQGSELRSIRAQNAQLLLEQLRFSKLPSVITTSANKMLVLAKGPAEDGETTAAGAAGTDQLTADLELELERISGPPLRGDSSRHIQVFRFRNPNTGDLYFLPADVLQLAGLEIGTPAAAKSTAKTLNNYMSRSTQGVYKLTAAALVELNKKAKSSFKGGYGNGYFRGTRGMRVLTKERVSLLLVSKYYISQEQAERGLAWLSAAPAIPTEERRHCDWQLGTAAAADAADNGAGVDAVEAT